MNNLRHTIEENWEDIKEQIKNNWEKLTDNDIKKIDGSYKELSGKLQDLYGYKAAEVQSELTDFFESSDFEKIKNKTKAKMEQIKQVVLTTLDEYFQSAKQKSLATEKAVIEYATENPFKLIGLAATAGILIGCFYKSKKN